MKVGQAPSEQRVEELVRLVREVHHVLSRSSLMTSDRSAEGPQLHEMSGRTNIEVGRLSVVFASAPDGMVRPGMPRQALNADFSEAASQRYACVLLLMARQLATSGGARQMAVELPALRRQCREWGVPDRHGDLRKVLMRRVSGVIRTGSAAFSLEFVEAGVLSPTARLLCRETVEAVFPLM